MMVLGLKGKQTSQAMLLFISLWLFLDDVVIYYSSL